MDVILVKAKADTGDAKTKPSMFKDVSTEKLKQFRDLIGEEISRRDEQDKKDNPDDKISDMSASEFATYVDKTLSANKSRAVYRGKKKA
jgi:hypothetical protein